MNQETTSSFQVLHPKHHKNIDFLNIETYHIKSKPNVKLSNKKNCYNFMCSISHEKQYAIGLVIILKDD